LTEWLAGNAIYASSLEEHHTCTVISQYYLTNGYPYYPESQNELISFLAPVRAWLKNLTITFDPYDDVSNSVDWHLLWDEFIPASDDFINTQLRAHYRVPLRKTQRVLTAKSTWSSSGTYAINDLVSNADASQYYICVRPGNSTLITDIRYWQPTWVQDPGPSQYQDRIIDIAALYVAWRIESRTYAGAQNPGSSEYAEALETQLNTFLNEVTSDKVRLTGQTLKGGNRFINPRIMPYPTDSVTRESSNASSGISEFSAPSSGR